MSQVRGFTEAEAFQAQQSPLPWRFLGALGLAAFGSAWGFLDIMAIAVVCGGESEGTVYAGAYVATTMVFTALTVPQVSRASDRLGDIAAFRLSKLGLVLAWGLAGILLLQGLTDQWLLLVFAPFFGALAGFSAVLNPLMAKHLIGGADMSRVFAVMSAVGAPAGRQGRCWEAGSVRTLPMAGVCSPPGSPPFPLRSSQSGPRPPPRPPSLWPTRPLRSAPGRCSGPAVSSERWSCWALPWPVLWPR